MILKEINVGDKIGNWEVINIKYGDCKCLCKCNSIVTVKKTSLLSGASIQCRGCNVKDRQLKLINQKFNQWTIIEHIDSKLCKVRCECGYERKLNSSAVIHGYSKRCSTCNHKSKMVTLLNVTDRFINKLKALAGKRGHDFAVSKEYLNKLLEIQNYKCNLSGVDICIAKTYKLQSHGGTTASLDRIDSSKGYIEGNVQWVHKFINIMKGSHNEDYFIDMCKNISKYIKRDLSLIKDDWKETSTNAFRKVRKIPYNDIQKVRELYKDGNSCSFIANQMNMSLGHICLIVKNKVRVEK